MSQAEVDAKALRKAMEGFGTDDRALIKICANRTNAQRQAIKSAYKSIYGRDIIVDLKDELHGKFEDAMIALFTEPIEYDCDQLYEAMEGAGTNEDTLIEIIASRAPTQLIAIKRKFKEKYKKDLEEEVKKETSGTLRNLLLSLLKSNRKVNTCPNTKKMASIAKEIYLAGEGKKGTDESVFAHYFCSLSPHELLVMSQQYHKLTGHNILEAIDKEFYGDSEKALKAIVYATLSPSEYFATRVNDAIKGWGTNDILLIRILITRDEIDMPQIKQYYKKLYGQDMVQAVKDDISGDYQKLMIELCDH